MHAPTVYSPPPPRRACTPTQYILLLRLGVALGPRSLSTSLDLPRSPSTSLDLPRPSGSSLAPRTRRVPEQSPGARRVDTPLLSQSAPLHNLYVCICLFTPVLAVRASRVLKRWISRVAINHTALDIALALTLAIFVSHLSSCVWGLQARGRWRFFKLVATRDGPSLLTSPHTIS